MNIAAKVGDKRKNIVCVLLVTTLILSAEVMFVKTRSFESMDISRKILARTQIDTLAAALMAYRRDTGHYPTTDKGLNALVINPGEGPKWRGPYYRGAIPLDPWGRAYLYRAIETNNIEFELASTGPDEQVGGSTENRRLLLRQSKSRYWALLWL